MSTIARRRGSGRSERAAPTWWTRRDDSSSEVASRRSLIASDSAIRSSSGDPGVTGSYHRDMIEVRHDPRIDVQAFAQLRERCGFDNRPPAFLAALIAGSRWIAHAHDSDRDDLLVGFARAISDGVATAYLSSVMVDPAYRRCGVGRALVQRIMQGREDVKFVLHSRQDATPFYTALGFVPVTNMMARNRR